MYKSRQLSYYVRENKTSLNIKTTWKERLNYSQIWACSFVTTISVAPAANELYQMHSVNHKLN